MLLARPRASAEKNCVIAGFRHGINEIFALMGCYAA